MNSAFNYISINDITFSYGDKCVFQNYSVAFPTEKTSVIMSPSGSGKTTLLYLISGLLMPIEGNIAYPVSNPRFSMVFQDSRLIDNLSVCKNIRLVNPAVTDEIINETLCSLGLGNYASHKVKHLSGGEKQRVAIARALLADYDILLMDEPFTGIDDDTKNSVMKYIKNKTAHKTVLLVTHDKTDALFFSDSIIEL